MIEKYPYIFYSVIGRHVDETRKQIIERKYLELENCKKNHPDDYYSLWAAKIDEKSLQKVWNLSKDDRVFVLGKYGGNPTSGEGRRAEYMILPDNETKAIYEDVDCRFLNKNYAYLVKEYKFLKKNETVDFDFGKYDFYYPSYETPVSASKYFDICSYVQNNFAVLADESSDRIPVIRPVRVIMELQYPFVVKLK